MSRFGGGGYLPVAEVEQLSRAHIAARSLAREHVRSQLGNDTLQGARHRRQHPEPGPGRRGHRVRPARHPGPSLQGLRPPARPPSHGAAFVTGPRPTASSPAPTDLRAEMRRAAESLGKPAARPSGPGRDLGPVGRRGPAPAQHGWEAVDVVFGSSIVSIPPIVWTWGSGEIAPASEAHNQAVRSAAKHLASSAPKSGATVSSACASRSRCSAITSTSSSPARRCGP